MRVTLNAASAEISTFRAETVQAMARWLRDALPAADVLIMAAAPADFRPARRREENQEGRKARSEDRSRADGRHSQIDDLEAARRRA